MSTSTDHRVTSVYNTRTYADSEPPAEKQPPLAKAGPIQWAGRILAASSFFGGIEEFTPLKVKGRLETWIDAYERLVDSVFGWIEIGWFGVHPIESHFLVIAAIVFGAMVRGFASRGLHVVDVWVLGIATVPLLLLPALILPWPITCCLLIALAALLVVYGMEVRDSSDEDHRLSSRTVRRELCYSAGILCLLIFLNYTLFAWVN